MEELLLELSDIKEEQKIDKAQIAFLRGFVQGLDQRLTAIEKRHSGND